MNTIKINKDSEDFNILCWSDSNNNWKIIEEGNWIQDGKYQFKENIVLHIPTNKYYKYNLDRNGSPFTEWNYGFEYENYLELKEVQSIEETVVIKKWIEI